MNPDKLKDLVERIAHGPDISDTDRILLGPNLIERVACELDRIDPSSEQAKELDAARAELVRAVVRISQNTDEELTTHLHTLEIAGQPEHRHTDISGVVIDGEPSAIGITQTQHQSIYLQQLHARKYALSSDNQQLVLASRDRLHSLRKEVTLDVLEHRVKDTPSLLALRRGLRALDQHYLRANVDERTALERVVNRFLSYESTINGIHDRQNVSLLHNAARLYLSVKSDLSKERHERNRALRDYCEPILAKQREGSFDGRVPAEQSFANLKTVLRVLLYDAQSHARNDADAT